MVRIAAAVGFGLVRGGTIYTGDTAGSYHAMVLTGGGFHGCIVERTIGTIE